MSQLSIEELYVSYYGRAADPAGLNYWLNQEAAGQADATIAMNFAPQLETLGLYPLLNTPTLLASSASSQATFINAVYQNLFGHAADTAGLSYWQGQLTAGASPGFMVNQIILGALGTDATTIVNRATVAGSYTNAVASAVPAVTWNPTNDTPQSRTIIATINASASTVTAANAMIAADITLDQSGSNGTGVTLTLSGGGQTISPTSTAGGTQTTAANDTVRGVLGGGASGAAGFSQLATNDSINGGGGVNTLNSVMDSETVVNPALALMQLVNLEPGVNGQTFNGASSTGITTLSLAGGLFANDGAAAGWTLNVIGIATSTNVGMMNATGFNDNLNVTFTGMAVSGNSATVVLNGNAGGGTFDTNLSGGNGINTYNVQSTGTANTVVIGATDTQLTTENISGSASLTQTAAAGVLTTINGSAATGALNITAGAGTGKISITGGSGANTLNASNASKAAVLNGGVGGKDTLIFNGNVAANTLTGGGSGVGDTERTTAGGLTFITNADVTSATTLSTDVDVITDYAAGNTTIDIKGGGTIFTLSGTQLSAVAASSSLLTAAQLAGTDAGAKGLVAFAFNSNEYVLQLNTNATFQAGDGLLQLTGAAATFKGTDLTNA